MAFSCQLVGLPMLPRNSLQYWPLESLKADKKLVSYFICMPTSQFTDVTEEQFVILIFQCLVTIIDTGSL